MNKTEKLNDKELEELRKFFENDHFAMNAGCRIDEAGSGWSVCSMNVTDAHRNAFGMIMGGAMVTLADFAAAVIGNRPGKYTTANSVTTNETTTAALSGMGMTPQVYAGKIRAVTAEDVVEAAKTLALHTTYFLKGGSQ